MSESIIFVCFFLFTRICCSTDDVETQNKAILLLPFLVDVTKFLLVMF